MQSKLLVNVQEDGSPCITVIQQLIKPNQDLILAEKVLQQFFDRLRHESPFLGVINANKPDSETNTLVRTIIPLTIPHAMDWMRNFFLDASKNSDTQKRINEAFDLLHDLYKSEARQNNPASID